MDIVRFEFPDHSKFSFRKTQWLTPTATVSARHLHLLTFTRTQHRLSNRTFSKWSQSRWPPQMGLSTISVLTAKIQHWKKQTKKKPLHVCVLQLGSEEQWLSKTKTWRAWALVDVFLAPPPTPTHHFLFLFGRVAEACGQKCVAYATTCDGNLGACVRRTLFGHAEGQPRAQNKPNKI